MTTMRTVAVAAAIGVVCVTAPGAVATQDEFIGRTYAPEPRATVVSDLLDVADKHRGCAGHHGSSIFVIPGPLEADTFLTVTGEIYYLYRGMGGVYVSRGCSGLVRTDVRVVDVAPAGKPGRDAGPWYRKTSSDYYYSHTHSITTAENRVTQYEGLYARGNAFVSVEVKGAYQYTPTGQWFPVPCEARMWQVTPTPAGPRFGDPVDTACTGA